MQMRGTILQPWNWHTPRLDSEGKTLWKRLMRDAEKIRKSGYTAVWLPPASKASGGTGDVGYAIKDWYDLDGTRYGDAVSLKAACQALRQANLQVYHDQVHNHLIGGEDEEDILCLHVKKNNKNEPFRPDSQWFRCTIPTRFPWLGLDHSHFDAYHPNGHDCWVLRGKRFDCEAHQDPWGGCDLDFDSMDVVSKLEAFGNWYRSEVHVDGYRFDAVKHIRPMGTLGFLTTMRQSAGANIFAVGEFLHEDIRVLHKYITATQGQISLFDVPLQRKLVRASLQGRAFDISTLLTGTLTKDQPTLAVPYVHSHDDQPPIHGMEHLGHYVGDWFISQAYALILLRDKGYPLVADTDTLRHPDMVRRYMRLRQHCTFGHREDRFDHPNTVGWSFSGGHGFDNSMAVVMTNGDHGRKWLPTGRPHTCYRDFTDALGYSVTTNEDGWAEFECPAGGTSAWVEETKYRWLKSRDYETEPHLPGA
ncbi:alpha-amylase [Desulfonema ishimotonii]|uniref:Alpha-amylase n=1 Tax=Desulfonema ishimotonii TaxID=45657 RepID=A0A401FTW9_9BACT|nr:alpha-amylase family glycosyl hydrolase [Desulfonema ishimotonii]GBC60416.1 alpha-amylase [Desulfonema ishimotonii]